MTVSPTGAAHLCLGISLNKANHDVGGDEASPAREQYALGIVLPLRLGLAVGEGAGKAVYHLSSHNNRVVRRRCKYLPVASSAPECDLSLSFRTS